MFVHPFFVPTLTHSEYQTTIINWLSDAYLEPEPYASIEHGEAIGHIFQCSW